MMVNEDLFIKFCLQNNVLQFGDFTLKSGRKSPYFFNAGLFCTSLALKELGDFYAQKIIALQLEFDVLFGAAYKGIPLALTTALSYTALTRKNIEVSFNRKEAKNHGEGGSLLGASLKNKKVLLIDDVITAGTATREVLPLVRTQNAHVVGLLIALDRMEQVDNERATLKLEREEGIKVYSIASIAQVLEFVKQEPAFSNMAPTLENFLSRT